MALVRHGVRSERSSVRAARKPSARAGGPLLVNSQFDRDVHRLTGPSAVVCATAVYCLDYRLRSLHGRTAVDSQKPDVLDRPFEFLRELMSLFGDHLVRREHQIQAGPQLYVSQLDGQNGLLLLVCVQHFPPDPP